MPYNYLKRDNPAQPQRTMLKGSELLNAIDAMQAEGKSRSEQCRACGYEIDGKLKFTDFYTAILEARGTIIPASETIEAEDADNQDTINELLEDYPADAIRAFIEYFGEDVVENFSESYQGMMTGAEFAEQLVTDCYCLDIPGFVEINWQDTWENLRYDYIELDDYIFSCHF